MRRRITLRRKDTMTNQLCAKCHHEPVWRPGDPGVPGRFCGTCIDRCHEDTALGHWCAVDRYHSSYNDQDEDVSPCSPEVGHG
ncbi:hypothetical protein GCM10012275_53310 [Longimycelium tulufanense]|uniref:Uncharacterized protein n=1 Tax=Longimycelium tulufanense TaxID=907463 RepID=A0A8J3CJH4_9PSEU|nr:hypothetical protein GCM10012275_53310 [Longimycelium tulufanense]